MSTSFVTEQVKKLDNALTNSFQKNLIGTKSIDFSCLSEKDQFLYQATQALDVSSITTLPSFEKIQYHLEAYQDKFSAASASASTSLHTTELEWLFIAKCTIAIYGQVFSKVLNLTLPISESIDYWNQVHGNTWNEVYYALQVAPTRIYGLLKNTANTIRYSSTAVQEMKSLFTSTNHVLTHLFPIHSSLKKTFKNQPFNAIQFFTLSTYHKRPFLLEMIRDEVDLKKKALQKFRSEQAGTLGIMLLTPPQFGDDDDFIKSMAIQTRTCIEMIKYVMMEQQTKNVHHLNQHLNSTVHTTTSSASDVTAELYTVVKTWSNTYQYRLQCIQSSYGKPSFGTQYWIPILASYVVGNWTIRYGLKRKEDIMDCLKELGKTGHDFILNWVWKPVLKVYETIRLKDQRLSILSKQGLQSDMDSLERMVIGFARDHLHLSNVELTKLVTDIRDGDMSIVLKEYEKEIKTPLKNVIAGDLLQTILIQVQKTKVDVDLAMSALDKLLKSNELNFAFLAVAPSMLVTWATFSWFKNTLQGRSFQKMEKLGLPMRETLRRVERQLILGKQEENQQLSEWTTSEKDKVDCETQGILLCEVHLLRNYAKSLPRQYATRARFLEDMRDLENINLTTEQKIQTIARMYRFYKFL